MNTVLSSYGQLCGCPEILKKSCKFFCRGLDIRVPLRYNNDKRKKPLFSRGLSVCRHLFNSFSKLKSDEKNIEKRRLFH